MTDRRQLPESEIRDLWAAIVTGYDGVPLPREVSALELSLRSPSFHPADVDSAALPVGGTGEQQPAVAAADKSRLIRVLETAGSAGAVALLFCILLAYNHISSARGEAPDGVGDPGTTSAPGQLPPQPLPHPSMPGLGAGNPGVPPAPGQIPPQPLPGVPMAGPTE